MKAEILNDWFTFTVTDREDPDAVIRDILGIDPGLFQDAPGVVRGYYKALGFGNIYVGYEPFGFAKGVCVSMSGQGCRTYESLGKSFEDLRALIHITPGINCTRWDIACDEKSGLLDMDSMIELLKQGGMRSHCKKRKVHLDFDGDEPSGATIYIGSRRSDFFIRIYDKAKETYDREKEPEKYNQPWIRVELVLKKQYAENALDEMENRADFGAFVAEIINGHMAFINRDDSNISRCSKVSWWAEFLDSLEQVKLWSKGETEHSFDKSIDWVSHQYGPTLAMLHEGLGSLGFYYKIIQQGKKRMTARQSSLLADYHKYKRRVSMAAAPV